MYAANRTPEILHDRLSADFYAPTYIEIETKINNCGSEPIRLGTKLDRVFKGAFYLLASEYEESGIPFIRVTQINSGAVDLSATVYISEETHRREQKTEVKPGDLLFAKGGAYRHCAVVPYTIAAANISQDLIGAVTSIDLDSHYAHAFLVSHFGRPQLIRWEQGDAQPHLSNDSVKHILLPFPEPLVQKHLGDKVRQAERLQSEAARLAAGSDSIVLATIPIDLPPTFRDQPRHINNKFVTASSLNPEHGRALEGHTRFRDFLLMRDLVDDCKCGDPIRQDARVAGEYWYYGASGPIDRHDEFNFDGEYLIVAQDGTIGRACVARGRFWANNHVWILKVKDEFDPDAVAAYLDRFYPFWQGMTTGSVVPKVTAENLLQVVVPRAVAVGKDNVGVPLRKAGLYRALSTALTVTAKNLVEALIEEKITEEELVNAQQALERGDRSLDRTILARLSEDGIDVAGKPPLFADLDALYAAIDEAQLTQPSNGDAA